MKGKKTESRIISKRVNTSDEAREWLESIVDGEPVELAGQKVQRIESFAMARIDEGLDVIVIVETEAPQEIRFNAVVGSS